MKTAANIQPLFHRPVRTLVPYLSPLVRPLLRFLSLPAASSALVSNSTTLRHVLHLAHSEMGTIRAPDESWFRAQAKLDPGDGVHGAWSAGNIDGWVGADGPLVRGWLGEERVLELEGVPHAFCLCKFQAGRAEEGETRKEKETGGAERRERRLTRSGGAQPHRRRRACWVDCGGRQAAGGGPVDGQ